METARTGPQTGIRQKLELADELTAISIVAGRLAQRLRRAAEEEKRTEGYRPHSHRNPCSYCRGAAKCSRRN